MPTRVQGTVEVLFLCDCPGRPHDTHTERIKVDQVVNTDKTKMMLDRAIKHHYGKARYKEIAKKEWIDEPTLTECLDEA
jgi:hypothetical protein